MFFKEKFAAKLWVRRNQSKVSQMDTSVVLVTDNESRWRNGTENLELSHATGTANLELEHASTFIVNEKEGEEDGLKGDDLLCLKEVASVLTCVYNGKAPCDFL
jgi:hypothetical protein